jgi:hypothetical protein
MSGKVMIWSFVAMVGCSGDDPPSQQPEELWCTGYCALLRRCGLTENGEPCVADCAADRPGLRNLSPQGARAFGSCAGTLDCPALFDEARWSEGMDACWARAQTEIEPQPGVRAFCSRFIVPWFECGYWFGQAECERIYGMWADPVLDRVESCVGAGSCEALEACVSGVFESL